MSDLTRRLVAAVVTALLTAVIVIGLASAPAPTEDRVAALAERIRCPVCQNEAIADSPSETARQMLAIVAEKVAAGESDAEIEQFFIDRYGEWVILDPPFDGRFLLLWGLPAAALGIGALAIWTRRRGDPGSTVEEATAAVRGYHAELDLAEIEEQVEAGEIDPAAAEGLRRRYREELEAVAVTAGAVASRQEASPRSMRRVLLGWGIGLLAMGVVVVMVAQAIEPPASAAEGLAGRDLSEVSNEEMEAVIADNPEVVGMRIALADRYYADHDYEPALTHYLEVLRQDPSHPTVWARVGWIVYQAGEPELAASYVEQSLEMEPELPEASLYLGMIRLYGLDDPESALPLLHAVAEMDGVPAEIMGQVEDAIAEAEAAIADG